jgi:hypothetical protein
MKTKRIAAALLIAIPATAAQAMDVATFLAKADGLQKKGMMALFASDYGVLKAETQADVQALVAEARAAKAAGRAPAFCPQPGKMSLASNEIIAALRAVPAAQRPRTDVKEPLRTLLARKYPCR